MGYARPPSSILVALFALAFGGCQNNVGCGTAVIARPLVQLLYPEPGATNVPADVGLMVFAGTFPAERTPIALSIGANPPSIRTQPTGVPPTIPSPAATPNPDPSVQTLVYAVAVPALSSGTTYSVLATQTYSGCADNGLAVQANVGNFTTK
jgi:hypothetical protein